MQPVFLWRESTQMLQNIIQHFRFSVRKEVVTFKSAMSWYANLPFSDYFFEGNESQNLFGFEINQLSLSNYNSNKSVIEDDVKGYFFMTLGQDSSSVTQEWKESSFVELISNLGGIGFTVAAVLSFLFEDRTRYVYDMSRLKRFFYFAKEDELGSEIE